MRPTEPAGLAQESMLSAEPLDDSTLDNGPQLGSSPVNPPKIPAPVMPTTVIDEDGNLVPGRGQAAAEDDSPASVRIPAALAGMNRDQSQEEFEEEVRAERAKMEAI